MNTIDQLREELNAHARITDTAVVGRGASIHHRIHVVRRRRRAAAVLGTVAAVLVLVAGIALPSLMTGRRNPGFAAAPTVTVGGFQYRLVEVVETKPGAARAYLDVARRPVDMAVALLAQHLDGGSALLRLVSSPQQDGGTVSGLPVDRIEHDGNNPAVSAVEPARGQVSRYRIEVSGGSARTRVGIALYQRTKAMPPGVVDATGKVVFRRTIGSQHLVAAGFALPGQGEVTVHFTGRVDEMRISSYCAIPGRRPSDGPPYVNVSIDGDGGSSYGGCGEAGEDAGGGGFTSDSASAGEHTVRVWTSETMDGPARVFPHAILGGAVYDDSAAQVIDGMRVDPVIERDGRTWRLDPAATTPNSGPGHSVTYDATGTGPLLFGYVANNVGAVRASVSDPLVPDEGSRSAGGGARMSIGQVSMLGRGASYTVSWPAKDKHARVTILVYRPVR